jgi:hypothetical protein
MKRIVDLGKEEKRLSKESRNLLAKIRAAAKEEPGDLAMAIRTLESLRKQTYEDINQIQHEAIILRAVESLQKGDFTGRDIEWHWNPRQTGTADEPDLRGIFAGHTVLSAEITSSPDPKGGLDSRMRDTLEKLSAMEGKKVFFVRTASMLRRAKTKVSKARYQVEVRLI